MTMSESAKFLGNSPYIRDLATVVIGYGMFIQSIVDFVIIIFCIFMVVKAYNSMQKAQEAAPAAPSDEVKLLTEIRDALKK